MSNTLDSFKKMFYFKYFEKYFCQNAHYITVPIEEAKRGYYPEFRDKIRVIPQGFNFNEIEINQEAYRKNDIPTFAYAGGLIPGGRDPRQLLDYLISLNWGYKFILYTKSRDLVKPYVDKSGRKIEIRDYIPRDKLLQELARMDFLVNFENETSRQQPSKLIDYYLTGRPVLSVPSTDVNTKVVNEFLCGDYSHSYNFGDMCQYRIENVCNRFLSLSHSVELQCKT